MPPISRRSMLAGLTAALGVGRHATAHAALPELTIWGPPAGPSITIIHAMASGLLRPVADRVNFKSWRSPDELRAGLTSRTMDVFILPTQTAANLYNRGLGVRLLNVMTNGLLYLVSADQSLNSMTGLQGRSISVPFRNDTPEVIFRRLLQKNHLSADTDVTLRFAGSPMESVQFLMTGRVDAALLPEPAATMALLGSGVISRQLHRTLDIQKSWGDSTGLGNSLPQAGLGVTDRFLAANRPLIDILQSALETAARQVNQHPDQAAAHSFKELWVPAPIIEKSIPHSNLVAIRASQARSTLDPVFKLIGEFDDKIIGGKLPDADFYL